MKYPAGMQLDNNEDVGWAEEEIMDDGEVTGPDLSSMILRKVAQVWEDFLRFLGKYCLNCAFADFETEFEYSPRIRSAPHSRFSWAICWISLIVSGDIRGFFW